MLQNRLDNSVKHFCYLLTKNKTLRENIDHYLKERSHFNMIWNKLLRDIASGKKVMVELIEQATLAFDQREEWCLKIIALKKREQNDFHAHLEEMRDIQRKLDHDLTLREFLSVKGQKRILKDLEEKERKKRELEIQNLESQLTIYQKTMEQIQEFVKEQDVQRMASQFLKQEEENFALFNYVNELSHEIELFNGNINDIQEKIDEQVEISTVRSKQRQSTIKNLTDDLNDSARKMEESEKCLKNAECNLNAIFNGIEGIFNMLVCDKAPILELVSTQPNVTLFNVRIYLGTIERKVSALIAYSFM